MQGTLWNYHAYLLDKVIMVRSVKGFQAYTQSLKILQASLQWNPIYHYYSGNAFGNWCYFSVHAELV